MSGARRVVALALGYWAAVFALGFVLGTVRALWLAPRVGAFAAVMAELPVMLGASGLIARRLLARHPLPGRGAALVMGALAFALLLACEAALARWGLGQSPGDWARSLIEPPGLAGLAGQAAFALLPALLWRGAEGR